MTDIDFSLTLTEFMKSEERNRIFLVLVLRRPEQVHPLDIDYACYKVQPLPVSKFRKKLQGWSGSDVLLAHTISGGLPQLAEIFFKGGSREEVLAQLFQEDSPFVTLAEKWFREDFRSPDIYMAMMFGLAMGKNRMSQVGKLVGFPNNKCDKYLKALMSAGYVVVKKVHEKTEYHIHSGYLLAWFTLYYPQRNVGKINEMVKNTEELLENSLLKARGEELFLSCCLTVVREKVFRTHRMRIGEKIHWKPTTLPNANYVVDFFLPDGNGDIVVKVISDESMSVGKAVVEEFLDAVAKASSFFEAHIFLCTMRRVTDYVSAYAGSDVLHLVSPSSFGTAIIKEVEKTQ